MYTSVDELTVAYEEDGQVLVEELDKVILSKGAWSTVIFRYRERNRRSGEMGPDKFSIRRYQKRNGSYTLQSKFNITNVKQAAQIRDALSTWLDG